MINIAEILKNSHKGTKIYSSMLGEVTFTIVNDTIKVKVPGSGPFWFDKYGRYTPDGECLLFPSKDNRDWSTFKKLCPFKPFDKVVCRCEDANWDADFFSYYSPEFVTAPYQCVGNGYQYCLPYNEETAKLIGTTNEYNG